MRTSKTLDDSLWPVHPKPREDELLSSWLVRLAHGNGLKVYSFGKLVWGPDKHIWNRDIDRFADDEILATLSRKTGTSFDRAKSTTISAFTGTLFERHNPNGYPHLVLPLGIYHRIRTHPGMQFCPKCLKNDFYPYYRRKWRLAFSVICPRHRIILHDRCQNCSAPVNFHRIELGKKSVVNDKPLVFCSNCGFDLRGSSALKLPFESERFFLKSQEKSFEALDRGWTQIEDGPPIYSHLYFRVLRHLMKLCSISMRGFWIRNQIHKETPLSEVPIRNLDWRNEIEHLSVDIRTHAAHGAYRLLDKWPHNFLRICKEANAQSAVLLSDFKDAPYWYWRVVMDHFYCPRLSWHAPVPGESCDSSRNKRLRFIRPLKKRKEAHFRRVRLVVQMVLLREKTPSVKSILKGLRKTNLYSRYVTDQTILKAIPGLFRAADDYFAGRLPKAYLEGI